jgi:hypothetical protein
MIRNWVFNEKYIDIRQGHTSPFELDIISRWSRIRVSQGDNYILLSNQPHDFRFKEYGEVKHVADAVGLPYTQAEINENNRRARLGLAPIPPRNKHTVHISPKQQLQNINRFDDLVYSLLAVKNYARPMAHFQRQYRGLSQIDYDTIIKDWLYVARTAFGKLVNALPNDVKLEFMLIVMRDFKTMNFTKLQYDDVFDKLEEYIEGHILSQGRLLIETERMLREIGAPAGKIGFYDEENLKTDLVQTQARLFQDLFAVDPGNTLIQEIKTEIERNEEERRFDQIFKDRAWPLYID